MRPETLQITGGEISARSLVVLYVIGVFLFLVSFDMFNNTAYTQGKYLSSRTSYTTTESQYSGSKLEKHIRFIFGYTVDNREYRLSCTSSNETIPVSYYKRVPFISHYKKSRINYFPLATVYFFVILFITFYKFPGKHKKHSR